MIGLPEGEHERLRSIYGWAGKKGLCLPITGSSRTGYAAAGATRLKTKVRSSAYFTR